MMKGKQIVVFLLSVTLLAGMTACSGTDSGKEKEKSKAASAKGKYVEDKMESPQKDGEQPIKLIGGEDGKMDLYVSVTATGTYKKYSYDGSSNWTEEEAVGFAEATANGGSLTAMAADKNGAIYVVNTDAESKAHVWKMEGGIGSEIPIPYLVQKDGNDQYPYVRNIMVLQNGNLLLTFHSGATIINAQDGSEAMKFEMGEAAMGAGYLVSTLDNKLVCLNPDANGFSVYDGDSGNELSKFPYDGEITGEGEVLLDQDNGVFYLNRDGLHHLTAEGSIVETLVEGASASMGSTNVEIKDFISGGNGDFYVLYVDGQNGTSEIKHYAYDKDASTMAAKTITVYGLKENATVRQAITEFQNTHKDVKVDYKNGSGDEAAATKADNIRVLNTELLNGSGADVLILDGLPVQSYIDKGVLTNLNKLVAPLVKSGSLQENIVKPFEQKGKKIYSVPIKYGIPIFYGAQDKVDAMKSLDTISAYLQAYPDQPLFSVSESYGRLVELLMNIDYQNLFGKKQQLKSDRIELLLDTAKKLGDSVGIDESIFNFEPEERQAYLDSRSAFDAGGPMEVKHSGQMSSVELKSRAVMMVPFAAMRESGISPTDVNQLYVPQGLVGINAASKNKKIAEEFIKTLLSLEVQKVELMDGFPVNRQAIEQLIEGTTETPDHEGMLIAAGDIDATLPIRTEVRGVAEIGAALTTPVQIDSAIQEMIINESKAFFEGTITAAEAAKAIANKADIYLAE